MRLSWSKFVSCWVFIERGVAGGFGQRRRPAYGTHAHRVIYERNLSTLLFRLFHLKVWPEGNTLEFAN